MIFKDNTILVDSEDHTLVANKDNGKDQVYVPVRDLLGHVSPDELRDILKEYQLFVWRRRTNFCGVCGAENGYDEKEGCRLCPECGERSYPFLFPAVIVSIIKDDKILLAHNANFPGDLVSVIAGFVDVGEGLEEAVVREVQEEVGLEIKNLKYVASQNWGFSSSLMIGFTAEHSSGDINIDGVEIVSADWYGRDELPESLPPEGSIGRFLIESFRNSAH